MGEHVLLVGMMGSGKSTVGRIVADRMRRPFRDSDVDVERRTGSSVTAIFAARAEPAYRAEERAALCAALTSFVPSEMPNKFAMAVRQPIGVCGMITPWNF